MRPWVYFDLYIVNVDYYLRNMCCYYISPFVSSNRYAFSDSLVDENTKNEPDTMISENRIDQGITRDEPVNQIGTDEGERGENSSKGITAETFMWERPDEESSISRSSHSSEVELYNYLFFKLSKVLYI